MRQWLLLETSMGNKVITEMHEDGTVIWNKNQVVVKQRSTKAHAKLFTKLDTKILTVNDIVTLQQTTESLKELSGSSYAHDMYNLLCKTVSPEPPDSTAEQLAASACKQAPPQEYDPDASSITFDLDPLRGPFDWTTIKTTPVEPVDSMFGGFGGRCLILRHCLTTEECRYLIKQMEGDLLPCQYRHDYRRNDRCVVNSTELAAILWERVRQQAEKFAIHVDIDNSKQHFLSENATSGCPQELRVGWNREGDWYPVGLNECLRFCRYTSGGFFRAHSDACFCRSEDEQSLFTCMFYLNGDFEGGATRFFNYDSILAPEHHLARGQDDTVISSIDPEAGMCLLFFQPGLLHEGDDVQHGQKYILRTDVMFRRDPSSKPQRTPQQEEAYRLVQQAQTLEEKGECDAAARLYRRAFKLEPPLERYL